MPVVDINGEKKKVACGPCIRGHRSSKCQHSDRVLMEVRKPGRPLSACPHPSGSCGCQRAVFYTVPKNESSPSPTAPLSPAVGVFNLPTPLSTNRIQKSKLRKNSTSVNTSSVQRAFDGDPSVLAQHATQRSEINLPTEPSESSSTAPSLVSSSSSTPQTEAVDIGVPGSVSITAEPMNEGANQPANRLQLGMLGVGGYRTISDELGWTGEWPDYNSIPPSNGLLPNAPPQSSCCGGPAAPPELKPVVATRSCCARKPLQPENHIAPASQQFSQEMQDGQVHTPSHIDISFPSHFSLPGPAFNPQPTDAQYFTEDQFGCLHEPDHSCSCGPGCECLGCSMHPANRTTMEYVRYHTELASSRYINPIRMQMPPTPNYVQQQPTFNGGDMHNLLDGSGAAQVQQSPHFLPHAHLGQPQYLPQWQMIQHQISSPIYDMSQISLQQSTPLASAPLTARQLNPQPLQQPTTKSQEPPSHARQLFQHESSIYDHESPSTEDDASTLSPSAFSVQHFNIPGCNDVTGSCLCGDGCQCEGCLTHNGHGNTSTVNETDGTTESNTNQSIHANSTEKKRHNFSQESFDDILQDPIFVATAPG